MIDVALLLVLVCAVVAGFTAVILDLDKLVQLSRQDPEPGVFVPAQEVDPASFDSDTRDSVRRIGVHSASWRR